MTHITYADGIAIGKIVYYVPCLLLAGYVSLRHGWGKNSGWIYLAIFSVLRIISGAAWLASINSSNPKNAITTSLITGFLGFSPLLLAALGLLSRVYHEILEPQYKLVFTAFILRLIQTPAGIGLILCIVGATSANDVEDITQQTTLKVGIVIFDVVFIALAILSVVATILHRAKGRGEAVLVYAVLLSLPFLLVRAIAALLDVFAHLKDFNAVTGSQTVELCMEVLMEAIVVFLYLVAGFKAPILSVSDRAQLDLAGRASKGLQGFRSGRGGLIALGVSTVVDMIENRGKPTPDAELQQTYEGQHHGHGQKYHQRYDGINQV